MAGKVAIVGATGQLGGAVAKALVESEGADVVGIIRRRTDANAKAVAALEGLGVTVAEVGSLDDEAAVAAALRDNGCSTVVVTIRATGRTLVPTETHLVNAAVLAGCVKRFVPDEWGVNTAALDGGECPLFDAKRTMQEKVKQSGLDWTLVFTGGFAHYHLPTFHWGSTLNTFGHLDTRFATFHLDDIGALVAKASLDPRTKNKIVQFDNAGNMITQAEALSMITRHHPHVSFQTKHTSATDVVTLRDKAMGDPEKITAEFGHEPDADRWGINYVNLVLGRMVATHLPETVTVTEMWPDYSPRSVEDMMRDKAFVGIE